MKGLLGVLAVLFEVAATIALIAGVSLVTIAIAGWQEWQEHGPSPGWFLMGGIPACIAGAIVLRISPRARRH